MSQFEIKITGSGTPTEIVDALAQLQRNILASTPDELDGAQWEDPTLMTQMELI